MAIKLARKSAGILAAVIALLVLVSPAASAGLLRYTFIQEGFDEGAVLLGTFTQMKGGGPVLDYFVSFSGNSIVPAFTQDESALEDISRYVSDEADEPYWRSHFVFDQSLETIALWQAVDFTVVEDPNSIWCLTWGPLYCPFAYVTGPFISFWTDWYGRDYLRETPLDWVTQIVGNKITDDVTDWQRLDWQKTTTSYEPVRVIDVVRVSEPDTLALVTALAVMYLWAWRRRLPSPN